MFKWLRHYYEASPQTKYFVLNWLVYGIVIIATTIYCYARLDFVRSNKSAQSDKQQHSIDNKK